MQLLEHHLKRSKTLEEILKPYQYKWQEWLCSDFCFLNQKEQIIIEFLREGKSRAFTAFVLALSEGRVNAIYTSAIRKLKNFLPIYKQWLKEQKPGAADVKTSTGFLNTPIECLPLSSRVYYSLRRINCNALADLINYTSKELLSNRGIGKKTIEEIKTLLEKNNCLHLWKA